MTELDHTGRNEYRDLIYMERQSRAYKILKNDPDCVPILIERYEHELHLPLCRRTKIILKKNAQVSEIIEYLRNDMKLHGNQTLYLMTNGYYEYDMKKSVGQLYEEAQDDDGFLYMTYISQPGYNIVSSISKWSDHLANIIHRQKVKFF